ncbi:MAG TPA: phosphonate C-P lyase system protein PhnH [Phototrophicaceae bacterium]|nr:phosphonate C-P lyase system protein PhnH [Phototrophicaceae bacterium]
MQTPVYSPEEAQSRDTFLALMWSLSYPGRTYSLPAAGRDAYLVVAETLLDLETSYFTPDQSLALALSRTNARALPPDRAQYHFYPELVSSRLNTIAQASIGTMLYPDRSATLIIGCELGSGQKFRLSGPGIAYHTDIKIGLIPDAFWELRSKSVHFPLGWDVFLISGSQVVGLPRSAAVEKV